MKGTLREGSLTGNPERYVKQGSEMGSASIGAPLSGRWWVTSFLGPSYLEEFL